VIVKDLGKGAFAEVKLCKRVHQLSSMDEKSEGKSYKDEKGEKAEKEEETLFVSNSKIRNGDIMISQWCLTGVPD